MASKFVYGSPRRVEKTVNALTTDGYVIVSEWCDLRDRNGKLAPYWFARLEKNEDDSTVEMGFILKNSDVK